jgi:nicotinate-nucleotide--dimethylbenzimidazole phosphoribosyltransferase
MFTIEKPDRSYEKKIRLQINGKTKPLGALGDLENLAKSLAIIFGQYESIQINEPTMFVFAGDHGFACEGVSIAPSEVTQQMVLNFLNGGAAINCFCRTNNMKLKIVDAGILLPIDDERLIQQSLGLATNNFLNERAMTLIQVNEGLIFGKRLVEQQVNQGCNIFGFGEMGIGNTSSAAAIQAVLMNIDIAQCVGRGTGIDDDTFVKKKQLLIEALDFHQQSLSALQFNPLSVLSTFGGFEIVQMVGAMLAAAENRSVILVDGYIATAAALAASKISPNSRDYMIFCHRSQERGHQLMLEYLSAKPLLDLGLRLGEGTGAALALPLVRAAASFYNDMASFESAGVTAV